MLAAAVVGAARRWLEETGSTRAAAIVRIGLAFLLWLTWGDDFAFFRARSFEALIVAAAFYATSAAMLIGLFSQASAMATGAVAAYIYIKLGVLDGADSYVHHHTALLVIAILLCSLTPCGRSFSVDRARGVYRAEKRGGAMPVETGPLWATRLHGLLVSTVYLGGAVSKSSMGWLSGDRLEQIFAHYYGKSAYPSSPWMGRALLVATVSVVALEYALALGLWFKRTRRFLLPLGIVLHVTFYLLLPIETFSLTMVLLYLGFEPELVNRFAAKRVAEREPRPAPKRARSANRTRRGRPRRQKRTA